VEWVREIATAAPAAFVGGLLLGLVIGSRYTLVKKDTLKDDA
jgi:hypothetical protein